MRHHSLFLIGLALAWVGLTAGCESPQRSVVQRDNLHCTIPGTQVSFEMVWISDGGFWMGKTEVTWDEYLLYCDFENPARETGKGVDGVSRPSKPLEDVAPYDRDWGLGRRPAVGMSWNAAKRYCEWLSGVTKRKFRLPTEAEWALACGPMPSGPLAESAWFAANSDEMTQEVGQKRPNANGLYDTLGNLWEYCAGPFSPKEPERAVLRGGSWDEPATRLQPQSRLGFEDDWVLEDPNVPAGVWWVPDGSHLGLRILCEVD
jgi:formylglycine-generating enzyme required for sulfatase activity